MPDNAAPPAPHEIHEHALQIALYGDVKTNRAPIIFTSCRRSHAEEYVENHAQTALIHHTPAGEALEHINVFARMPHKLAHLYWFILSARYVLENDFPDETLLFGDVKNESSTAFNIETPLLMLTKPNVKAIIYGITGERYPREGWLQANLVRTYLLHNRAFSDDSPAHILFKIFNTATGAYSLKDIERESALKNLLRGLLEKHLPSSALAYDAHLRQHANNG